MSNVVVTGGFDDPRAEHIRFLQQAARYGDVHVLLWPDESIRRLEGKPPKFPAAERQYFLEAIRYVSRLTLVTEPVDQNVFAEIPGFEPDMWVVGGSEDNLGKSTFCKARGLEYRVLQSADLAGFPDPSADQLQPTPNRKKVLVTGCYDWFHSGHVRFFEEVAALGDLYVVVGHDANVHALKGKGHPLFPQEQRRYIAQSIRHVKQCLISTGHGWLDAEPEIERLKPDIYAVNEDGDKPEKRDYCQKHGIEYRVLTRMPKEGLPRRQSTTLRGF